MRANLTFYLPDEEYLFECAIRGIDIISQLRELQLETRSALKHGHEYKTAEEVLEFVNAELCDILSQIKDCG